MSIVWRCQLSVDEHVTAGKSIDVPRLGCPDCETLMRFRWGYWRDVRAGGGSGRLVVDPPGAVRALSSGVVDGRDGFLIAQSVLARRRA